MSEISVAAAPTSTALTAADRHFLLRRLHSLTGIVPLGAFMLFHFFENASARRGAAAFDATVLKISQMPYIYAAEIFLLAIPIAFHSLYGLFITASARPELTYGYARNWAYIMQRVTGLVGVVYLLYHVASTRIWALFVKGDHFSFNDMAGQLQNEAVLVLYVIGIVSLTFHFANGLWSFSITWGLVKSKVAQERLAMATMGIWVALCVIGLDILSAFVLPQSFLGKLGVMIFGS